MVDSLIEGIKGRWWEDTREGRVKEGESTEISMQGSG